MLCAIESVLKCGLNIIFLVPGTQQRSPTRKIKSVGVGICKISAWVYGS